MLQLVKASNTLRILNLRSTVSQNFATKGSKETVNKTKQQKNKQTSRSRKSKANAKPVEAGKSNNVEAGRQKDVNLYLSNRTGESELRHNQIGIQLIPWSLYRQIFSSGNQSINDLTTNQYKTLLGAREETTRLLKLTKEELIKQIVNPAEPVSFQLPKLEGHDLNDHFRQTALKQTDVYTVLAKRIVDAYTKVNPDNKDQTRSFCLKNFLEVTRSPESWLFEPGWVRYDLSGNGKHQKVDAPLENVVVFDVEVQLTDGGFPVMATALSDAAWYAWSSPRLFASASQLSDLSKKDDGVYSVPLDHLIPLRGAADQRRITKSKMKLRSHNQERLVIGHNVSFDRGYIQDQYSLQADRTRFMDTMSLHIAMYGMTGEQRQVKIAQDKELLNKSVHRYFKKRGKPEATDTTTDSSKFWKNVEPLKWTESTSLNNLNDVFSLHVANSDNTADEQQLKEREQLLADFATEKKEMRSIFIEGSIDDIRTNFQNLMTYCANDVRRTLAVFCKLWPQFGSRFPHPVSLAGMLEMNNVYLPVNNSWTRFVRETDAIYSTYKSDLTSYLRKFADGALSYSPEVCAAGIAKPPQKATKDEAEDATKHQQSVIDASDYSQHLWLWNEDWRVRKQPVAKESKAKKKKKESQEASEPPKPKRTVHMAGYPLWYSALCPRKSEAKEPSRLSTQMHITPKLLCLSWDGWPLHYEDKLGWGFLMPGRPRTAEEEENAAHDPRFPYQALCSWTRSRIPDLYTFFRDHLKLHRDKLEKEGISFEFARQVRMLFHDLQLPPSEANRLTEEFGLIEIRDSKSRRKGARSNPSAPYEPVTGPFFYRFGLDKPYRLLSIPQCWFFKLPHRSGPQANVGNPLSKDFAGYIPKRLRSELGADADRALELNRLCQYWTNNVKRLNEQLVVWISDTRSTASTDALPAETADSQTQPEKIYADASKRIGAILPRIITSGTVTRRAVEPTWLTATKPYQDRIGSEQRSLIQAPPGFHFVSADVDAQELWIAALIGDATKGTHGATPIGWLTLQGDKSTGTDLHSRVAGELGIDREKAKVLNYARFYGAGVPFATNLLRLYNSELTEEQASQKMRSVFRLTKGIPRKQRSKQEVDENKFQRKTITEDGADKEEDYGKWAHGYESRMFNELERIANLEEPRTPVLNCRISESLMPAKVSNNYLTSRINWVVQSSGVDYLHLMLVALNHLIDTYQIDARFVISVHDEIRYLVCDSDVHRFAVVMQVANLWTRAVFCERLGVNDLPLNVAFFSSIEIDKCWRKSVTDECRTPSNRGMLEQYGIRPGTTLDIHTLLKLTDQASFLSHKAR